MVAYSIYLHIPFCRHRCGYCDFNTYAGLENLIPDYVDALTTEVAFLHQQAGERLDVHTVFFGGGTPSLLPKKAVEQIIESVTTHFQLAPQAEISLEANPGTLSPAYLKEIHGLGINRLSLGVQSANPEELRLLEREHNYSQVIQAMTWARKAGFENVNLDLIFGLPEQSLKSWQRSLRLALDLQPEHFSIYALTIEHGTPFGAWARRGLLTYPDPDVAAEMYEWASEILEAENYTQYEISNWAIKSSRPGTEALICKHNLQYWRNFPYLGLGAGAHGFAAAARTVNVRSPKVYIQRFQDHHASGLNPKGFPATPATRELNRIDRQTEMGETMMMGLRLTEEGVSSARFQQRFGEELRQAFPKQIDRLVQLGLLEWVLEPDERLRLTRRGRLLGNQVFIEFI